MRIDAQQHQTKNNHMPQPLNEFSFIESLRNCSASCKSLEIGIGDDAAAWRVAEDSLLVTTVDMLMEGVHFTVPPATPLQVGRKVMGVNLSDLAAMAARPQIGVVSIATPRKYGSSFLQELQAGMQQQAEKFSTTIIGGDTNIWEGPLVVSVTLMGTATKKGVVKRSDANKGDWIFCTGTLGGSILGKHLDVTPRVREALFLHEKYQLHAMIDISDGLIGDLFHILEESNKGATLFTDKIPIAEAAFLMKESPLIKEKKSPLKHALSDGEDFELLFTLSSQQGEKLLAEQPLDIPVTHIGIVTEEQGCKLHHPNGTQTPLTKQGWEHSF